MPRPDGDSLRREFGRGVAAMLPICIAAIPIALVWGTLASERGLSLAEISLMSVTVFAGASQFVAIGLWATPLPAAAIVFATFMVNLRHVMMGASLARHMAAFRGTQRFAAFYGLTDEVWALAEARALHSRLTPAYYAGLVIPLFVCWTSGSLAGGVFGAVIGRPEAWGLDFVFAAMFIALIVGFRKTPAWFPVVVTSATVSALSYQILPVPWYVILGSLVAVGLAAVLNPGERGQLSRA